MSIKAIAWDIDGTLIDSEPLHLRALQAVCKAFQVDISDLDDHHFVGVNVQDVWKALQPRFPHDLRYSEWLSYCNNFYLEFVIDTAPIQNAFEAIDELKSQALRQVAVSNSNRAIVDANLKQIGVDQILEFSLSLDDVELPKPDPQPYLRAAKRLGIEPANIIAVEDSPSGCESAQRAGFRIIGVSSTYKTLPHVIDMVDDLSEIPKIISKL